MPPASESAGGAAGLSRRLLRAEVLLVFAVSLGASGAYALLALVRDLTAHATLASQRAVVTGTRAPGRPWIDLGYQLLDVATGVVPVLLVVYLLVRSGESLHDIGLDGRRRRWDTGVGATLAAVVGGAGLGLYLAAHALGANLTVVATNLPDVWWRIPVLVLSAVQNAVLEEVLVVGYLLRRLGQLGWGPGRSLLASAVLRGSYHLYQGFGGFAGNAVMGLLFGRVYQRWGRVAPLVLAHSLIDTFAFVGYALLAGKVSWLPH